MQLSIGDPAPEITLKDQHGVSHSLSAYKGKPILLYFYAKDDTPGCTSEACSIRDNIPNFSKQNVQVLGVSTDNTASHAKFAKKFELTFPILADEEKKAVNVYGVWGQKEFMGRSYMGTKRTSFLINGKGKIAKIYEKVKPEEHADEVLRDLASL